MAKFDIYHHEFAGNDAHARNLSDAIAALLKGDAKIAVSFGYEQQNPVLVLANPYSENAQDVYDISVDGVVVEFSHVEVYDDCVGQPHGDIVDEPAPQTVEAPVVPVVPVATPNESEQTGEQQPTESSL